MLKLRITFVKDEEGREELENMISDLEKNNYEILHQSKVYHGRGNSKYSNVYLEVKKKNK